MLTVALQGGLGNQLFQIAFGIARTQSSQHLRFLSRTTLNVSEITQAELMGKLDENGFEVGKLALPRLVGKACNFVMREYSKGNFSRYDYRFARFAVESYLRKYQSIRRFIPGKGLGFFSLPEYDETLHELAVGYFQTYRWAKESKKDLLKILDLDKAKLNQSSSKPKFKSIVVHVRRGDYDKSDFGFLGPSYYRHGIEIVQHKVLAEQILLFSDDLSYAAKLIREATSLPIVSLESAADSPMSTLRKMSGASGYVIANSSLSWWAAFLSECTDGTVVAPNKWFKGFDDPRDLIPPEWIRLDSHFL